MAETTDVAGQVVSAGIDVTRELADIILKLGTSAGTKVAQIVWKGVAVNFVGPLAWNAAKALYCNIRNGQVTMTQLDKMSHNNRATIDFASEQKNDGTLGRFLDYLHKMRISYALSEHEDVTYVMIDQKDVTVASPYLRQLGWESVVKPEESVEVPKPEAQHSDFSYEDYSEGRREAIKNQEAPARDRELKVSERTSGESSRADKDRSSVRTRLADIKTKPETKAAHHKPEKLPKTKGGRNK